MQAKSIQPSTPSPTSPGSLPATHGPANLPVLTGTEPLPLLGDLERWTVAETPPGSVEQLSTVNLALMRGLAPASAHQFQQAEADLARWMRGFGIQTAAPEVVLETYRKTLSHLPADLLVLAVERIITTYKWPKPPPPADILATVASELAQRRRLQVRAVLALKRMERMSLKSPASSTAAHRPYVARVKRVPKAEPQQDLEADRMKFDELMKQAGA